MDIRYVGGQMRRDGRQLSVALGGVEVQGQRVVQQTEDFVRRTGLIRFFCRTQKYEVQMVLTNSGWVITTPFCPGKGPWNYGIKPVSGEKAMTTIELVEHEEPYNQWFKEKKGK